MQRCVAKLCVVLCALRAAVRQRVLAKTETPCLAT
jgi:hypothetical protein